MSRGKKTKGIYALYVEDYCKKLGVRITYDEACKVVAWLTKRLKKRHLVDSLDLEMFLAITGDR